ncbi:MAG: DUF2500 domain-containing protein [Clostridia bacterium]|nr:DUF2500 domain-containing protein [Clostridia bacterium]
MFGLIEFIFPIFFIAIFGIVIGTFVGTAVKGVKTWNKNNNSPRLTVWAKVVTKRNHTGVHSHNHGGHHHTTHSSTYFVTFEVESGDRMELQMDGFEFGMLVEGDEGKLTFQGTRYLGFERE